MTRLFVVLALLVMLASPAHAALEGSAEALRQKTGELAVQQRECVKSGFAAEQLQQEILKKSYLSPAAQREDEDRAVHAMETAVACAQQAGDELEKTLGALELRCQIDLDRMRAGADVASMSPDQRAKLEDTVACGKAARELRLGLKNAQTLGNQARQCELEVRKVEQFVEKEYTAREYTNEGPGTARAREEDRAVYEEKRQQYLQCARVARAQQAQLKASLKPYAKDLKIALVDESQEAASAQQRLQAEERKAQLQYFTDDLLALHLRVKKLVESEAAGAGQDELSIQTYGLKEQVDRFRSQYFALFQAVRLRALATPVLSAADAFLKGVAAWQAETAEREHLAFLASELQTARVAMRDDPESSNAGLQKQHELNIKVSGRYLARLSQERKAQFQTARQLLKRADDVIAAATTPQ